MAFTRINWQKITSSLNDAEPRGWSYSSTTDSSAVAEIGAYFNDVADEITSGDFLYARFTDGSHLYQMTVSGSAVTISRLNPNQVSYTLPSTTNAGGATENFYMSIFPVLTTRIGTIMLLDAVTGTTDLTFEFYTSVSGSPASLGFVNFTADATTPLRKSFSTTPIATIGNYFETYWRKTNTGTAQAVRFLATIDGTSP